MAEQRSMEKRCEHTGERDWFGKLLRCRECGEILEDRHECWFDRNGYCVTCGKDGGPKVRGP